MINDARTAIKVGNSVAVTLPRGFVKPGEKLELVRQAESITITPKKRQTTVRAATNEEVAKKFAELERRYGKLYDDLARIP